MAEQHEAMACSAQRPSTRCARLRELRRRGSSAGAWKAVLTGLLVTVACGEQRGGEPDFVGVYTVFTPNDAPYWLTDMEELHIDEDGTASMRNECRGHTSSNRGAWEQDGDTLRVRAFAGSNLFGWGTDLAEIQSVGCESIRVTFEPSTGPGRAVERDYFKYVPCWGYGPPEQNENPGPTPCVRFSCPEDERPDCDWAQ